MTKIDKQINEIESAQQALRDSIEQTKDLADKAEKLVQRHKESLKEQAK